MYRVCVAVVVFLTTLGVTLTLFCGGCNRRSGPPVEFVLPDGFTGPVWLALDPEGQTIPLVDGRYRVAVPPGGVLRVQSYEPFNRWHDESARFADGTPLPCLAGHESPSPRLVTLRGGGTVGVRGNGTDIEWLTYFVGTEQQYREQPFDAPPPDGR